MVSDYALSTEDTHTLLKRVGLPLKLTDGICDLLARPLPRANTWSRARGIVPGRRVDVFELFAGLALTCRGTMEETLSLLFSLFDVGGNGVLGEDDLGALIFSCASVLRRLGFSLPLTADDSAYLAGEAFLGNGRGRSGGTGEKKYGHESDEFGREELDLPMFLRWAQRAEIPIRAFEVLALPHRFSRAVDQALAKIALLRGRYAVVVKGLESREEKEAHPNAIDRTLEMKSGNKDDVATIGNHCLDTERVLSRLQECGTSCDALPLSLSPVVSSISSRGVCIALEAGRGGTTASSGPVWCVVAMVEARQGSRFSLVDAQTVYLEEGHPIAIKLSGLRPATDHRFQLVHRAQPESVERGHDARRVCSTVRFKTLPTDFRIAGYPAAVLATIAVEGVDKRGPKRRQIEIIGTDFQSDMEDESFDAFGRPPDTSVVHSHDVNLYGTENEGGVAVMVCHQGTISLEATEARSAHDGGGEPWWVAARRVAPSSNGPSDRPCVLACSLETESPKSLTFNRLSGAAKSITCMALFAGEGVSRAAVIAIEGEHWGSGDGGRSGSIDVVIHLRPNWHAPEAICRCFAILQGVSCTRMTVLTEDARVRVLREATTAVRALLSKTCGLQRHRHGLRNEAAREGTHVIIGRIDPWLGLDMVRGCYTNL